VSHHPVKVKPTISPSALGQVPQRESVSFLGR
jgi:hypothetical protein